MRAGGFLPKLEVRLQELLNIGSALLGSHRERMSTDRGERWTSLFARDDTCRRGCSSEVVFSESRHIFELEAHGISDFGCFEVSDADRIPDRIPVKADHVGSLASGHKTLPAEDVRDSHQLFFRFEPIRPM
jgi:hypothetical protein